MAVLLSGTAADDPSAPGADWARSGRYELPKRLLLASIESLFADAGETMPVVEPNAAWNAPVTNWPAPAVWRPLASLRHRSRMSWASPLPRCAIIWPPPN